MLKWQNIPNLTDFLVAQKDQNAHVLSWGQRLLSLVLNWASRSTYPAGLTCLEEALWWGCWLASPWTLEATLQHPGDGASAGEVGSIPLWSTFPHMPVLAVPSPHLCIRHPSVPHPSFHSALASVNFTLLICRLRELQTLPLAWFKHLLNPALEFFIGFLLSPHSAWPDLI